MGTVITVERFWRRRTAAPIIFVEMFEDQLQYDSSLRQRPAAKVLSNCRKLQAEARACGRPIAFAAAAQRSGRICGGMPWIEGFAPLKTDTVFRPPGDSCYSSEAFLRAIEAAGRCFLLAGFSGERFCLATLIDTAAFGHHGALIRDASSTWPLPGYTAQSSHRAVAAIASRYATILDTSEWLASARTGLSELEPCREPG